MSASVAAIIRNQNNEVLFTVRKHDPAAGMLDLPGGFIDLGETAENALVREIQEELNLNISMMKFIGTFPNKYHFGEIEYQTLDLVFNCTVESFENLQVADDVSGYVFRNPGAVLPQEIGLDSIREIVEFISAAH
jgi:mutator protein MutT